MRELSLFTGAGGGLLGTHLLGWKPCGYVEWNSYCQQVIAARIRDGYLPEAPIFTDVREFVQSGAAEQYRGIADVVTAGFPCQPFSDAGKQRAADDKRNMWPSTLEVIRRVQPRHIELENVRGLVSCGYIGTVLCDLASMGYVFRWGVLGACDAGAPHKRERLWIVADADRNRSLVEPKRILRGVAETGSGQEGTGDQPAVCVASCRADAANANENFWWLRDPGDEPESGVGRVAYGLAHRVDRLKAIGNGQVPAVVARAWQELTA